MKINAFLLAAFLASNLLEAGPSVILRRTGRSQVSALDFSPDGRTIAVGTSGASGKPDRLPEAVVEVWNLASGTQTSSFRRSAWTPNGDTALNTSALEFSPDGPRILETDGLALSVFDVKTGASKFMVPSWNMSPAGSGGWSPDSRRIALPRNDMQRGIWDVTLYEVDNASALSHLLVKANAVCFSPDGRLIAAVGYGCHISDAQTGRELFADSSEPAIFYTAAFSPDGRHLVVGPGQGGTLDLYDGVESVGSISIKAAGHSALTGEEISRVQFTPDGRHALTVSNAGIRWWDATGWTNSVQWLGITGRLSRDGHRIAVANNTGVSDSNVEIWTVDAAPWVPASAVPKR